MVYGDAPARALREVDEAVFNFQLRLVYAVLPRPGFDSEFDVRAGVWDYGKHVEGEDGDQSEVGRMRDTEEVFFCGHLCDTECARESAEVTDVRLNDIDGVHFEHSAPLSEVVILLAARYGDIEGSGDLCGPFELPIGTRLLEVADVVLFEDFGDFDGFFGRVTTISVNEE